jgi:hypothetical protein
MKRRNGAIAFGSVGGTLAPAAVRPSRRVDDVELDTLARRRARAMMPS